VWGHPHLISTGLCIQSISLQALVPGVLKNSLFWRGVTMNTEEKLKLVRQLLEGLVEIPNARAQQALAVLECSGLPFAFTTQFTDDAAEEGKRDLAPQRPAIWGSNFKHHLSLPESGGLRLLLKIALVALLLVLGSVSAL
jgi:hypothetical protein